MRSFQELRQSRLSDDGAIFSEIERSLRHPRSLCVRSRAKYYLADRTNKA